MSANKKILATFCVGVLVYQFVYASSPSNYEIGQRGFELAHGLNRVAVQNNTSLCSGDIAQAAAYIETAAQELAISRASALTALAYGQKELKEISNRRSYCAPLATQIKSYFEQVSLFKKELEDEPFPEPDETPDSCIT